MTAGPFFHGATGDINGDCNVDFIISVPAKINENSAIGPLCVVFGEEDGLPADTDFTPIDGTDGLEIVNDAIINLKNSGSSVISTPKVGDFNSDGIVDLYIFSPILETVQLSVSSSITLNVRTCPEMS